MEIQCLTYRFISIWFVPCNLGIFRRHWEMRSGTRVSKDLGAWGLGLIFRYCSWCIHVEGWRWHPVENFKTEDWNLDLNRLKAYLQHLEVRQCRKLDIQSGWEILEDRDWRWEFKCDSIECSVKRWNWCSHEDSLHKGRSWGISTQDSRMIETDAEKTDGDGDDEDDEDDEDEYDEREWENCWIEGWIACRIWANEEGTKFPKHRTRLAQRTSTITVWGKHSSHE